LNLTAIPKFWVQLDCPPLTPQPQLDADGKWVLQKNVCSGTLTVWAYLWVRRPPSPPLPPGTGGYGELEIDRKLLPMKVIFRFKIEDHKCSDDDIRCCPPPEPLATSQASPQQIPDVVSGFVPVTMYFWSTLPLGQCTDDGHCEKFIANFTWGSGLVPVGAGASVSPSGSGTATIPYTPLSITATGSAPTTGGVAVSVGGVTYQLQVTSGVCPSCQLNPDPRQTDAPHAASDAEAVWAAGGIITK